MSTTNSELSKSVNQKIIPFIWFEDKAEEAVSFYMSAFRDSKTGRVTRYDETSAKASGRSEGSVMTVDFQIEGMRFTAINGEPAYRLNPSVSFYISCTTGEEIDELWSKLSEQGEVMMKLDKYPFNDQYGWVRDKFGVSWQLILSEARPKISPCLMYVGSQQGRAEEAIKLYTDVFENSKITMNEHYREGQTEIDATVVHAEFLLEGQRFIAMDSAVEMKDVSFNESVSFLINCEDQQEIDYYWNTLSVGGDVAAQQCGWLKDKFGLSWQIVPAVLPEMLNDPDSSRARRVLKELLQMKKIDMDLLEKTYHS